MTSPARAAVPAARASNVLALSSAAANSLSVWSASQHSSRNRSSVRRSRKSRAKAAVAAAPDQALRSRAMTGPNSTDHRPASAAHVRQATAAARHLPGSVARSRA
jgi:hypothetical protein